MKAITNRFVVTALEKLSHIRAELCSQFLEREAVVEGMLCALLAGQHVLILGPPGSAKSELAHEVCRRVEGARYFQWLLTRFTTPEELFGPVSLKALEEDRYQRVVSDKLPVAHVAFLDEVFKASSAILNSLLSILNERRFHDGAGAIEVPLVSLVGASNELPEEEELVALSDRFLFRYAVEYLRESFRFLKMLSAAPPATRTTLSLEELASLRAEVPRVTVSEAVLRDIAEVRRQLGEKGVVASDRRYHRALDALRARAMLEGRRHVAESDLGLLAHILWSEPSEKAEIEEVLRKLHRGHEEEAERLLFQARELREYAAREWGDEEVAERAQVEALAKISDLARRIDAIASEARGRGRPIDRVTAAGDEVRAMVRDLLDEEPGEEPRH